MASRAIAGGLGLFALFVACSPFDSGDERDAPKDQAPAVDASAGADGARTTPDGSNPSPDANDSGAPLKPPRECETALELRTLDFETGFDTADWTPTSGGVMGTDAYSDLAENASLHRGLLARFQSTSGHGTVLTDGASVHLKTAVAARPSWIRVEWDAAVLQLDRYSAFGCTIGLVSDKEEGRAYLASGQPTEAEGVIYPTLDQWWIDAHPRSVVPTPDYHPAEWQHFALDLAVTRTPSDTTVTLQAFVDGNLAGEVKDQPWQPPINGVTSHCGSLYSRPEALKTATVRVEMDNVALWVCPSL